MSLENPFEKLNNHPIPPFKENLVDFPVTAFNIDIPEGYPVLLKQFKNNPEKIIKITRKENIDRFSFENNPVESLKSLEVQKESKKHYEEISNKYGIAVAPFEYVIGNDEDGKESVLYSISDRIYGDNLFVKLKEFKSKENIEEVNNLFISLINYFEDKFRNDIHCLGDIGNIGNYMYGHKKGEIKDKIYFVDIEPVLIKMNDSKQREDFLHRIEDSFYKDIEHAEKEMGVSLLIVRERYADFIKHIKRD